MKSIFELIDSKDQLSSANQGMAKLEYDQIIPLEKIEDSNTVSNFGSKLVTFRWHYPDGKWYLPNRSYIKMVVEIKSVNNGPITEFQDIAVAMGLPHSLFTKMFYTIKDKEIEHITERYPQIAAYDYRTNRTGQWLNTTGKNSNFWQPYFKERKSEISADNIDLNSLPANILAADIIDTNNIAYELAPKIVLTGVANIQDADQLSIDVDNENAVNGESSIILQDVNQLANAVIFRAGGSATGALIQAIFGDPNNNGVNEQLQPGDLALISRTAADNAETYIVRILRIETAAGAEGNNSINRIVFTRPKNLTDLGAANSNLNDPIINMRKILNPEDFEDNRESRNVRTFEVFFQPCMSIYKLTHALPGGAKHELKILPYSDTIYQKNGIESLTDKTHRTDFRFEVKNFELYNACMEGPLLENKEYILDLYETRCQLINITSPNATQYPIDVTASVYRIGIAFQDGRVLNDSRFLNTKFRIGTDNKELGLSKFYLRYGGLQLPNPDYDPLFNDKTYDPNNNVTGNTDKITELYHRNIMYNGGWWDSTQETYAEWRERGIYLSFPIAKTATDRESRAYIKIGFGNLTSDQGTALVQDSSNLIVFDTFKQICIIKVENGNVVEVLKNDV